MSRYEPAAGVAVESEDDAVYVASLPDGPIVVLEGTAALIWIEACAPAAGNVSDRVAARVDRDVAEIADDVESFLFELVAQGLLQEAR